MLPGGKPGLRAACARTALAR